MEATLVLMELVLIGNVLLPETVAVLAAEGAFARPGKRKRRASHELLFWLRF
jgi:hypothetical protein